MLKEIFPNKTNHSNKLQFHITQPKCKSNTHYHHHRQMTSPTNHFYIKSFVDECTKDKVIPRSKYSFFKLEVPKEYQQLCVGEYDCKMNKKNKVKMFKQSVNVLQKKNEFYNQQIKSRHKCINKTYSDIKDIQCNWNEAKQNIPNINRLMKDIKMKIKQMRCQCELNVIETQRRNLEKLKLEAEIFFINAECYDINNKINELQRLNNDINDERKEVVKQLLLLKKAYIQIKNTNKNSKMLSNIS